MVVDGYHLHQLNDVRAVRKPAAAMTPLSVWIWRKLVLNIGI